MSDSIPISTILLHELKLSLDDALRCINVHETDDDFDPQKAVGRIVKVRAELEKNLAQNIVSVIGNYDKIQRGHQLLRELDRVRRAVREDYGIKDAA